MIIERTLIIGNRVQALINKGYKVTIGILKEHDEKFNAGKFIKHEFGEWLK
jgi:hypothetical protein